MGGSKTPEAETMNPTEMLREFTDAVERRDGARFAALFREDGVYHDVFYGEFRGREAIADLLNRLFYETAEDFRWDMVDPVFDGRTLYVRYLFSYRSKLPGAGPRVMFEGVSIMKIENDEIAEYREVASAATAFADMNFAPERIAKILSREAHALRQRPEMARHF